MAEVRNAPCRILLATVSSDSHTWNLVYLQLLLEEHGYEVTNLGPCVPDAMLLDAVREQRPDAVVLSSVNGHGRTDGARLIRLLRADPVTGGVPAFIGGKLGTAGESEKDTAALVDAGFDAVFADPDDAGALLDRLERLSTRLDRDRLDHPRGTVEPTDPVVLPDLQEYVVRASGAGRLVVQPRMGMPVPSDMTAGLRAVAGARAVTTGTVTLDSYTRVGDHTGARRALAAGSPLNGFPLVAHGADVAGGVVRAAFTDTAPIPVQVRHGSAVPTEIFRTAARAGLTASEGGPVSYCLPYGRVPLAESVRNWDEATVEFVETAPARVHLETFGGCMLGQLCPPSLLIALSVLEALFFAERGVPTISLSYAQQTNATQDLEALAALRLLAGELLPGGVEWHLVLYTYMGVYPRTPAGAVRMLDASAELAVRGGAERLIVKTATEALRIPTVSENVDALEQAAATAARAAGPDCALPWKSEVDCGPVLAEARAIVAAVLDGDDVGKALLRAFASGVLDVPFCLHRDNLGQTQARIGDDGRLHWARVGRLPLPTPAGAQRPVGAHRLLTMLRHTADAYDTPEPPTHAPLPRRATPDESGGDPYRVAVVGSGPRGLAVVERLAARLANDPPPRPVELELCDAVEVGSGRIWRTDQPPWFLMNTVAGEVTMFSGPADDGPARAGAGPTLAEWWAETDPECPGPDGYAPRPVFGRYLRFVLDAVECGLPGSVTLRRVHTEVVDLARDRDGYLLTTSSGARLPAHRVVLATGHPLPQLDPEQQRLDDFARDLPGVQYLRGDSASDMPLDLIPPASVVGVLGLGLSFYDVLVALTIGRGGRFAATPDGALRFEPSGDEPVLVAGSRGGAPVPARGRNQKRPEQRYTPRVFTADRIRELRRRRRLDLREDVLPLVVTEMRLVYYATALRQRFGADVAERFTAQGVAALRGREPDGVVERVAANFGATDLPALDLHAWSRPFDGRRFADPEEFHAALLEVIDADLAHAEEGNVDGPRKAACDVLRDTRQVIRAAADFAGLTPGSHAELVDWFAPLSSFLAAGPPLMRLRQVRALVECGVLRVLGPAARFAADPATGRFVAWSPRVGGSRVLLDAMVDARIPPPNLRRDTSRLTGRLRAAGFWTSYVNADGGAVLDTGGVAVTPAPYHPIRADGAVEHGLYVLGIPTEHTRWFTQVGSGRPGRWTEFTRDADAIAEDVLLGLASGERRQPSVSGTGDVR